MMTVRTDLWPAKGATEGVRVRDTDGAYFHQDQREQTQSPCGSGLSRSSLAPGGPSSSLSGGADGSWA